MVYVMNRGNIAPPNYYYYNVIHEGYKDFKISKNALEKAYRESCKSIRNEAQKKAMGTHSPIAFG